MTHLYFSKYQAPGWGHNPDKCHNGQVHPEQVSGGSVPGTIFEFLGQVPPEQLPGQISFPRTTARVDRFLPDNCQSGQVPPGQLPGPETCPGGTCLLAQQLHIWRGSFSGSNSPAVPLPRCTSHRTATAHNMSKQQRKITPSTK